MRCIVQDLLSETRVTAEHVRGVVGGHAVMCGVIHPCHMWSMPHITPIKQLDSISIHVSSSIHALGYENQGDS